MSGKQTGMTEAGRSTERLVLKKQLPATREEVFAAWTDAEHMKAWMRPGSTTRVEAELDVRVGGAYSIDMYDGTRLHAHHGEYVTVDPPRKLSFTWKAEWLPDGSLVTVELFERDGGTELVLTHERLPSVEMAENHKKGWGEILDRLAGVLAER